MKNALGLMENSSFSSEQVESAHSAARMTMKSHRERLAEWMRCRSLVLPSQPLFPKEKEERQLVVIGRRLDVLSQKMLQRLNGKSVYFRKLSRQTNLMEPTSTMVLWRRIGRSGIA